MKKTNTFSSTIASNAIALHSLSPLAVITCLFIAALILLSSCKDDGDEHLPTWQN